MARGRGSKAKTTQRKHTGKKNKDGCAPMPASAPEGALTSSGRPANDEVQPKARSNAKSLNRPLERSPRKTVRVTAIGASAGGLEPIEQFFDSMPTDSGMAFVIIQHLSPDFRSMMDQLVARHSTMMIVHAEDGMQLEANVVYLNPPRTDLTIKDGKLRTRDHLRPDLLSLPIDSFFFSLAEDLGDQAIGVILSGTGSDGSRGGQAIRAAGGTLIIQEPSSAKFDSMPRSALDRNPTALVSSPGAIPEVLRKLKSGESIAPAIPDTAEEIDPERRIVSLLQNRYGADFGYYKQSTVGRRIRRRMMLNQIQSLETYAETLRQDTDELEALYCDLLIGVTAFFRDKEAFDQLAQKVIPEIAAGMSAAYQVRVWVAGCASGEEAYSIAILVSEFARKTSRELNLKVFATDIHFNSLNAGGNGVYEADSLRHVPQDIIDRYFEKQDSRFHVRQSLRKLVVFSTHNLIKDPPFTRLDLISCRNLLIYLDDIAQRKVLALFHFGLLKDGVLFLGPSESAGDISEEFDVISKKWRIFRKNRDIKLREAGSLLPLSGTSATIGKINDRMEEDRLAVHSRLHSAAAQRQTLSRAYDKVLEKFAPASFLIDRDGELVHILGNADEFLRLKSGLFAKKLVELLIPDLKLIVSAGIERVLGQHSMPFERRLTFRPTADTERTVNIVIERLASEGEYAEFLLVALHDVRELPMPADLQFDPQEADGIFLARRVAQLEQDLRVTEESLQSTIEELETSNEELQATNEELMASNEELQSTNEELHSVNEELYTVSAEHQRKIEELTELTHDMDNLLVATDIGTIFLDADLRVRRFTPAAAKTFNLVAHDIGRPLEHITYRFSYKSLFADLRETCETGEGKQLQIEVEGRSYYLRLLPYRIDDTSNAGAVLTMVDVQELIEARRELANQQALYQSVIREQWELICRYQSDTTLTFVNEAFCKYFEMTADQLVGSKYIDLVPEQHKDEVLQAIASLEPGRTNETEREDWRPDGSKVWLHWHRHAVADDSGKIVEIQAVGRDVTLLRAAQDELKDVNDKLKREEERFRHLYRMTPVMMNSIDQEGRIVEASAHWLNVLGFEPGEVIGRSFLEFLTEPSRRLAGEELQTKVWNGSAGLEMPLQMVRRDGLVIDTQVSASLDTSDSSARRALFVIIDVSDRLRAEVALARQNAELARINDNLNQFAHVVSHDLTGPLRAIEHTTNWIEEDSTPALRSEVQEHINRLRDQVMHLGGLLRDLFEYARAGSSESAEEMIDLPRELNDVFDMIEKPPEMQLALKSVPTELRSLRAPLLLIFRNLIENAVKYHDRSKGKITISSEDMSDRWQFSVEDDGPGIEPRFHDSICLPFRKLESAEKVPGNGMGLALVKKAVETNGGELRLESDPDERRGTRFLFSWPKDIERQASP